MMRLSELPALLDGKLVQLDVDVEIETISIDSRKTGTARGMLFIAIEGERHDGHDYIRQLYDTGLRNFIVERSIDTAAIPLALRRKRAAKASAADAGFILAAFMS